MKTLVFTIAIIVSIVWDWGIGLCIFVFGEIIIGFLAEFFASIAQAQARNTQQNNYGNYNSHYYKQNESKEAPKAYNCDINNYYVMLGIRSTATDDEVKQAYRNMVRKYHPDMVSTQGENVQRMAERKTQEINEVYQKHQILEKHELMLAFENIN